MPTLSQKLQLTVRDIIFEIPNIDQKIVTTIAGNSVFRKLIQASLDYVTSLLPESGSDVRLSADQIGVLPFIKSRLESLKELLDKLNQAPVKASQPSSDSELTLVLNNHHFLSDAIKNGLIDMVNEVSVADAVAMPILEILLQLSLQYVIPLDPQPSMKVLLSIKEELEEKLNDIKAKKTAPCEAGAAVVSISNGHETHKQFNSMQQVIVVPVVPQQH